MVHLLISYQMSTDDTEFFYKTETVHRTYYRNDMGLLTKVRTILITVQNETKRTDKAN